MEINFCLLILSFFSILNTVSALECYACSVSGASTDMRCVTNPGAVTTGSPKVNCNKRYCTIHRQEYKDPAGQIATFNRACEDAPIYQNKDLEDDTYKNYYRACSKNLCNDGSGKEPIQSGIGSDIGPIGILYVPGIGSSSTNKVSIMLVLTLTICSLFFIHH